MIWSTAYVQIDTGFTNDCNSDYTRMSQNYSLFVEKLTPVEIKTGGRELSHVANFLKRVPGWHWLQLSLE